MTPFSFWQISQLAVSPLKRSEVEQLLREVLSSRLWRLAVPPPIDPFSRCISLKMKARGRVRCLERRQFTWFRRPALQHALR